MIDVVGGQAQPDRTVVILGGHITEIGKSTKIAVPRDSQVVDATGKFLIPGLWDAHIHLAHEFSANWAREVSLPLLVANGITGVRDMGGDFELIKALRKEISAGALPGPRIIAAGPQLMGTSKDSVQFLASNNADAARRSVIYLKQAGVDFIKVQSPVPRDAYFAIAEEAKRQGLPFVGHVPELISAVEASDAGQRSMEHSMGIWQSCSSAEPELRKSMTEAMKDYKTAPGYIFARVEFGLPPRGTLDTFSDRKSFAPFRPLRSERDLAGADSRGRAVVRASCLRRFDGSARHELHSPCDAEALGSTQHLDPPERRGSARPGENRSDDAGRSWSHASRRSKDSRGKRCALARGPRFQFARRAGPASQSGVNPGGRIAGCHVWIQHNSLACRTHSGPSRPGKLADLVLLDANPLEDIRNTQKISGVFLQGRYFNRKALDGLLQQVKTQGAPR